MRRNSFRQKVLIYLSLYTVIVLGGIWLFQIMFLGTYYEWTKKSKIKDIAIEASNTYGKKNYSIMLDNLSYSNDVCIEISDGSNIIYSTSNISRGCLINKNENIKKYKMDFFSSNKKSIIYKEKDPNYKIRALLYGEKIKDSNLYVFISTSLEPVRSTISVLKNQSIYITFIILIISAIAAIYISNKMSRPIEKITKTSGKMAKGNYNVHFKTESNIKEIKELEQTLNIAVGELSKTDLIRREILANISHDLKTPLTLIKANSEMVKDLTYKDKEKRDKNLDIISDEVNRLNLLVEDILELSTMQSNATKLIIEDFNLNNMINMIIERFSVLCETNGYSIIYDGFDCNVSADKKRMEQVIYNLINNAVNYTGSDKKVYVKLIDLNKSIRVEIRDTGKGISKEEIKYIWDRYYKTDKKYGRVTYGTGLGLSIVKNLLNLHNFKYGVDSKISVGTTFFFEIKKSKK